MKKYKLQINNKEKGQALLFVVVAVTIALSVGISVSTRALNSQKRISSSDTATRVANAAEGGAEMMLGQTYTFLSSFTPGPPVCPSGFSLDGTSTKCVITYLPVSGDNITTKATVGAKRFSLNASDNYWFDLNLGMVKEIRLVGYPSSSLDVCWENTRTAIYTLSHGSSGNINKGWFVGGDFVNSDAKGFTTVGKNGRTQYAACATISLVSSSYGLRIRSLYEATRVYVYPSTGNSFPDQGYKITSVGELVSGGDSDAKETRVVVVYKSFPYAASIIDSGLYSATGGIN